MSSIHTSPTFYQIRKCQRLGCGMRYPVAEGQPFSERCPRCRGATRLMLERPLEMEPWQQPPLSNHPLSPDPYSPIPSPSALHALLDNVRSAWNVGSIFRTADGAGFTRMHLCGISPTPEIASVGKTALGADRSIPWEYAPDGVSLADELLSQGCCLWALEQDRRAIPVGEAEYPPIGSPPLVLVVGNEICGVDPEILERCQQIVYIPMQGGKRSLNAAVAFGIAAFALNR